MNVTLWIIAVVLAVVFAGAGAAKLATPKQKLIANPNMAWAEQFSPAVITFIGAAEVLAAIGLVVPPLVDVATVLVPLAASGLVLVMAGAVVTHLGRKEYQQVVVNLVLLALAAFVAWGRFGPHAF